MTSSILTFTLESFQQKGDRKGQKVFEEILSENFPKVMTDSKPLIWDARRTPEKIKYQ